MNLWQSIQGTMYLLPQIKDKQCYSHFYNRYVNKTSITCAILGSVTVDRINMRLSKWNMKYETCCWMNACSSVVLVFTSRVGQSCLSLHDCSTRLLKPTELTFWDSHFCSAILHIGDCLILSFEPLQKVESMKVKILDMYAIRRDCWDTTPY